MYSFLTYKIMRVLRIMKKKKNSYVLFDVICKSVRNNKNILFSCAVQVFITSINGTY